MSDTKRYSDKELELFKIQIEQKLFNQGWLYFQKYADKSYSLTDCLSFIIMQENNMTQALTLDHHFVQAGFQKFP